jgi:ATP-dependent exoDNAse (exonuclease V) beta subunit
MSNNFTIYRSSAGSGKTHTLVKEYIRLAISGKDYDKRFSKILAITFTNKASGEMKERVIRYLYTLSLAPQHKNYDPRFINEIVEFCNLSVEEVQKRASVVFAAILHNYHLLKITTIDKFTVSLVYSFARDLQIDADHEIVTDVNEVIDTGIDLLIEQSGKDEALTAMFVDFLGFEMDEGNRFNAKKELQKFCSKVMNEKGFEALEAAKEHTEQEYIDSCKKAAIKVNEIDQKVQSEIDLIISALENNAVSADDFYFKGSGNHSWIKKIQKKGFTSIDEAPRINDFIADKDKRWHKSISAEKQVSIERIENDIVLGLIRLFDLKRKESKNYIIHSAVRKNAFSMALFKRLHQTITDYKTSNSIILLSEFTQLVSNIVADEPAPFIYERLGERVKNIFVDEFQDTSTLQFSNLVPLMENSLSTNDFVMLVGDAKQSIYRWRNGNVEQFVSLPKLPPSTLNNHPYRQKVFLGEYAEKNLPVNYRSLQNVVEFNNLFFESIIRHPDFSSETLLAAYKDLKQSFKKEKAGGYVEFHIGYTKRNLNSTSLDINDDEDTVEEVNERIDFTVNSIHKALKNGYNYNDIAILIRKNKEGQQIAEGLRKKNIPVVSNQALSLRHSLEIKSVVSLLASLQKNATTTHVRSFALSFARFLDSLEKYETEIAKISYEIKLQQVFQLFGINFSSTVFDTLNLFEKLHYIAICLKMPKDNAFLAAFFELVFEFYKKNGSNSILFLEWWNEKSDNFKLQTGQNSNSVQVVTIHKSKGLQYPVVILPYVNASVRISENYFWEYNVPGYSIKPLPVPFSSALKGTEWEAQNDEEKRKSAFDMLNVFYVAFTRAEEQLYCYTEFSQSSIEKNPIANALTGMGWKYPANEFIYGTPVVRQKKSTEVLENSVHLTIEPETEFTSWYNKIKVSTYLLKEKHSENELRGKGIIMHNIAAKVLAQEDLEMQIQKQVLNGVINKVEAVDIKLAMTDFYNSSVFKECKEKSIAQLTEVELTDGKGNITRPDRIFVLPDNNCIVVDLKTGELDSEHHEQVIQYMKGMTNAGYRADEGWLYYFKTKQWIKVQQ